MKKVTNKYQNDMVKTVVVKLYESQTRFKQIEQAYREERKQLQESILGYMDAHGFGSFNFTAQQGVFAAENKDLKVIGVTPKKVEFDVGKLEETFDRDVLDEIIVKQYHIVDMPGLITYLKSCGVNPKKFKSFVECEKTVDRKAVDRLGEIGEIKKEDLAGCCSVVEGESYVKIQVVE